MKNVKMTRRPYSKMECNFFLHLHSDWGDFFWSNLLFIFGINLQIFERLDETKKSN